MSLSNKSSSFQKTINWIFLYRKNMRQDYQKILGSLFFHWTFSETQACVHREILINMAALFNTTNTLLVMKNETRFTHVIKTIQIMCVKPLLFPLLAGHLGTETNKSDVSCSWRFLIKRKFSARMMSSTRAKQQIIQNIWAFKSI